MVIWIMTRLMPRFRARGKTAHPVLRTLLFYPARQFAASDQLSAIFPPP
jgi:hypothetical protein